jgi:3-oxoadipate enol-lactonase
VRNLIVDQGSGPPLVLIPGIQGRWQYMRPAVDALAADFRVITFSLCGERASRAAFDPQRGFDNFVAQVSAVLADKRIEHATICGVSFGGLIALRFAALHPEQTAALVLASTPPPNFHLRRRHEIYMRLPWIFGPLFLAEIPWRMRDELAAAFPEFRARRAFQARMLRTLVSSRLSVTAMAARARLISTLNLPDDCARVSAPTLIVTGERHLDYVVPVQGSSEYLRAIRGARAAVLDRTGHLGISTRPDTFASVVKDFVDGIEKYVAADPGRPEGGRLRAEGGSASRAEARTSDERAEAGASSAPTKDRVA